jgi:malic enzyme
MLFKEFAGVDTFPLCLDTKDTDAIVAFVKAVAPAFGGVNLKDISAPRCFEIERRLRAELDIPVFRDDQHGTAIVVLAALINALRVAGKRAEDVTVVLVGAGTAGVAGTDVMRAHAPATSSSATAAAPSTPALSTSTPNGRRSPSAPTDTAYAVHPTKCSPAPTC